DHPRHGATMKHRITLTVACHQHFEAEFFRRWVNRPWRVAVILEPGEPPRFRLVGVDRLGVVAVVLGLGALGFLEETFHKDLDYHEA
ncbi:MAG: hypothetical protein V4692_01080, partial [Bdellovibrionota bacterium]